MRKNKTPNTELCGTPANRKTDHSRQLFGVCYEEMTQLDQEDYHLFHYSLVYTEDLHPKLCQIPLISLRKHHKRLMEDLKPVSPPEHRLCKPNIVLSNHISKVFHIGGGGWAWAPI